MKVYQVTESLSVGDAVSNYVVKIDSLLKRMGVCGGIFATNKENISKKYLHKIAEPISKFPKDMDESDVLLFHHAISNGFCTKISSLLCKKILIYHNITPPHFFKGIDSGLENACNVGLEQTKYLRKSFDFCITFSEFSKQNLMDMGYTCPIHIASYILSFDEYEQNPNLQIINKYSDGYVNILFVGRICPNKKQEDIIHIFALYQKYYNPNSRLILVGSTGIERYWDGLKSYISELGVHNVVITGSVPFADILAYYRTASLFVCMSEHEGFCIPLLEAMQFNIPVLAYGATAVPETMANAGVVLHEKDFKLAAGWIHRLIADTELRNIVLETQNKRLKDFSYESVVTQTEQLVQKVIELKSFTGYGGIRIESELSYDPEMNDFSVVIPIKASDWPIAKTAIPYIEKNIRPRKIYIVSSKKLYQTVRKTGNIEFLDENELVPGMTLSNIKDSMSKAGGTPQLAGYFLQQFIKLGFSRVTNDPYYLTWDADTLPLRPITFFDADTKKPLFNLKRECVTGYFDTMERLLGMKRIIPESFITEHMMFDSALCREFLQFIEKRDVLPGYAWWEKVISAADTSGGISTLSEFELFGTYVTRLHPDAYQTRKLQTLRTGRLFLGDHPSQQMLDWAAKDFDTISFEHFDEPLEWAVERCRQAVADGMQSFSEVIRQIDHELEHQAAIGSKEDQEYYRRYLLKTDFDFFFGSETVYERELRENKASFKWR